MRRLLFFALVVTVAALGAVEARSSVRATHSVWVANANRACFWAGSQRLQLPKTNGTVAQLLAVLPKITAIQVEELRRVRSVPPAANDRLLVTGLVGYWLKDIALERRAYSLLKASDLTRFRAAFAQIGTLERNEDVLLRALGTKCRQV